MARRPLHPLVRLRYGLARLLVKASTDFSIIPSWVATSVMNPTFRSLVHDGYQRSSAFFACVSVLAFAFPEPPLLVYDDEGDGGNVLPKHPLRQLLKRPMPSMGEAELLATTMVYLGVGGNAYWHKVRGAGGRVVQLKPYHAGQIIPVPGGPTWIKHYQYDVFGMGGLGGTTGGELPIIPAEDIVHFKWPSVDPKQPWMSQPPIVAAATEVDSDVEATRYVFALLANDAIPRTVVTIPADRPLLDGEYERIKSQFKERYGGGNRGDVAILEAGGSIARMSLNLQEMAFEAMAKLPESRIAAAMRVPPIIAGLNVGLDRSTFSNYGEARKAYAQDTLSPLWRMVASEITADLLPEFRGLPGADVRFDLSRVAALQEDMTARYNRTVNAFKAGLLTRDEARRLIGIGPAEKDGDSYYGGATLAAQGPRQLEDSSAPKAFVVLGDGSILALPWGAARVVEKQARPVVDLAGAAEPATVVEQKEGLSDLEGKIERSITRYLRSEYRKAADGVRNGGKAGEIDPAIVEQLGLDLGPGVQRIMKRVYPQILQEAFKEAEIALDVDIAWNVANKEVQAVLGELADLVVRVTETTRNSIRSLVGQAAAEGWSIDRLAKALVDAGATASKSRARMIARTETATAYSMGSLLAYAQSKVVDEVEWLATLDETTCPECRKLNGERRKLDKAFSTGVGHPPQHPNCRCALAPVVKS